MVVGQHGVGVVGQGTRGDGLQLLRRVALQCALRQDAVAKAYDLPTYLFFLVAGACHAYFLLGVIVGKVHLERHGLCDVHFLAVVRSVVLFVVIVAAASGKEHCRHEQQSRSYQCLSFHFF